MWLNLWRTVQDLHVHFVLLRRAARREGKVDNGGRWRDYNVKQGKEERDRSIRETECEGNGRLRRQMRVMGTD